MSAIYLNLLFCLIACGIVPVFAGRQRCAQVMLASGVAQIRSRGRIIQYRCNRGYTMLGEPYGACIRGKWDPDPPVCIKPGCSPIRNFKNGFIRESKRSAFLEFSCKVGYKLVGPSFIYCNGRRWSSMQPYCRAADISCNFESDNTCSWAVETHEDDDFMWHVQQQEATSRILGTGPKQDHTHFPNDTGHYIMIETADYDTSTQILPARIHSPKFPTPSNNNTCFIFWYHMFGSSVGMLNIFLNNKVVFQEKGNHGDRWIKGVVHLHQNASDLQLIIEGTHGQGYTGDIGLDDFSIGNDSQCEYTKVSSCQGRCGEGGTDTDSCLCSPDCYVDSSCCADYKDHCAPESTTISSWESEGSETGFTEDLETTTTVESESEPSTFKSSSSPSYSQADFIVTSSTEYAETSTPTVPTTFTTAKSHVSNFVSHTDPPTFVRSTSTRRTTSVGFRSTSVTLKSNPRTFSTGPSTVTSSTRFVTSSPPTVSVISKLKPVSVSTSPTTVIAFSTVRTNPTERRSTKSIKSLETQTTPLNLNKGTSTASPMYVSTKSLLGKKITTPQTKFTVSTKSFNNSPKLKVSKGIPSPSTKVIKHLTVVTPQINPVRTSMFTNSPIIITDSPPSLGMLSTVTAFNPTGRAFTFNRTYNRQVTNNGFSVKTAQFNSKSLSSVPYLPTKLMTPPTTKQRLIISGDKLTTVISPSSQATKYKNKSTLPPTKVIKKIKTLKTYKPITSTPAFIKSSIGKQYTPTVSNKTLLLSPPSTSEILTFTTGTNWATQSDPRLRTTVSLLVPDEKITHSETHWENTSGKIERHFLGGNDNPFVSNHSANQQLLIIGACAVLVLIVGTILSCFLRKRKRLRNRNGSEGDVLYVSSEEMLDFTLARADRP